MRCFEDFGPAFNKTKVRAFNEQFFGVYGVGEFVDALLKRRKSFIPSGCGSELSAMLPKGGEDFVKFGWYNVE